MFFRIIHFNLQTYSFYLTKISKQSSHSNTHQMGNRRLGCAVKSPFFSEECLRFCYRTYIFWPANKLLNFVLTESGRHFSKKCECVRKYFTVHNKKTSVNIQTWILCSHTWYCCQPFGNRKHRSVFIQTVCHVPASMIGWTWAFENDFPQRFTQGYIVKRRVPTYKSREQPWSAKLIWMRELYVKKSADLDFYALMTTSEIREAVTAIWSLERTVWRKKNDF